MLRAVLDTGYRVCGWLSALFVILILAVVLGQVLLNIVSSLLEQTTGKTVGLLIPSYSDLSGFFLAAATFFGMAYTFRAGGHIRVTLFISRLPARIRHVSEIFCLSIALLAAFLVSFEAVHLTHESWVFGDSSYGLLAIPIWIPQASFALGSIAFTISIADALLTTLAGDPFGESTSTQTAKGIS